MAWSGGKTSLSHDSEWRRIRKRILERDQYLCRCARCVASGRLRPASEVDHVVSRAKAARLGWTREQMHADSNLVAINRECHAIKTAEESGGKRRPKIGLDGFPIEL